MDCSNGGNEIVGAQSGAERLRHADEHAVLSDSLMSHHLTDRVHHMEPAPGQPGLHLRDAVAHPRTGVDDQNRNARARRIEPGRQEP